MSKLAGNTITFDQAQAYMKRELERHNLYVENKTAGGLSISMTQFGLSTVYADITIDEINYYIDNLDDDEIAEILDDLANLPSTGRA